MQFHEADQAYRTLRASLTAGELSAPDFSAQVNALRVQGPDGAWWQINPNDGTWLKWDGARWIADQHPSAIPAGPAAQPIATPVATAPPPAKAIGPFRRFILARSERWWDFFAIAGGCVSGGLWYAYSKMDVVDNFTPFLIAGLPVVIVLFRKLIDKALAPVHRILGRFVPRFVRIGAGLAVPYFLAIKLYGQVTGNNYEFRYMQHVLVWSVVLSYILIRQPGGAVIPPPKAPVNIPKVRVN
jgi:hypothetical protein